MSNRCIWALLLGLLGTCSLWAQDASVSGRVTDPSGSVVPKATVQVTNQATNVSRSTDTNSDGAYSAPFLEPGIYTITAAAPGFKRFEQTNVMLTVGEKATVDLKLEIGSVNEKVLVDGNAVLVNMTDASVSTVVDRNFAENLPMNGRSFQTLLYLAPGVTPNVDAALGGNSATGGFSVNGQRGSSNYWTVDGVSANIGLAQGVQAGNGTAGGLAGFNALGGTSSLVSVDALQEFRIQTSTYAPEFGRTPGGQISIATRSGTNQFHGSVFDYFRNTVLDATDWFAEAHGIAKAAEKQNDFGGVLGGPIVKDKTFFFFSYEGLRLRLPQTLLTTVPDLAARQAAIPAVQPFFNAYPLPNARAADVAPGLAPFDTSFSNPTSMDAYSLRIDHELASNLKLFGRYNHSPSTADTRGYGGFAANTVQVVGETTTTATIGATWGISPTTVNEARFNYSSVRTGSAYAMDSFGGGTPPSLALFDSPLVQALDLQPLFGTNMEYEIRPNAANVQHQYNVLDTLSIQTGSHSLKFGIDYRRLSPTVGARPNFLIPDFSDLSSFEAGNAAGTYTLGWATEKFLFRNLSLFAQDTWRISARLTLTYGLRWEMDFTPKSQNDLNIPAVTGFSRTNLSKLALAPAGTPIYPTRYGNVAPRVGMAYQISPRLGWELVLRSGFGVFYDLASTEVGNYDTSRYPYFAFTTINDTTFPTPAAAITPIPNLPPNATQGILFGFDPHLNLPYTLQWNVALEQSLGKAQTLTVSYLGSSGRRLLASEDVLNPNPNYAETELVSNAGNSNYNALQVQLKRRLSRGLQAVAAYSWAHSIDTGSYGGYYNGSFSTINQNRGSSDFDVRHTLSAALTYDLPGFRRAGVISAITRGWSLENIIQIHSAPPVDVIDGAFTSLTTQNSQIQIRPDVVPGQPLYLYGSQYPGGKVLNPGAFATPPIDTTSGVPRRQGDLGRNTLRGFGLAQWDFAVHRDFPVREALKLQFRAELFNVLNHPAFAPYNLTFGTGDPNFGQSTTMLNHAFGATGNGALSPQYQSGGPRSVQLALKLSF